MTSTSRGFRGRRSIGRWYGLALACAMVSATLAPRPARACLTVAPPASLVGFPQNGDTAVPTDVVPIFDKMMARIVDADVPTAAFELVTDSGETIALAPRLAHHGRQPDVV